MITVIEKLIEHFPAASLSRSALIVFIIAPETIELIKKLIEKFFGRKKPTSQKRIFLIAGGVYVVSQFIQFVRNAIDTADKAWTYLSSYDFEYFVLVTLIVCRVFCFVVLLGDTHLEAASWQANRATRVVRTLSRWVIAEVKFSIVVFACLAGPIIISKTFDPYHDYVPKNEIIAICFLFMSFSMLLFSERRWILTKLGLIKKVRNSEITNLIIISSASFVLGVVAFYPALYAIGTRSYTYRDHAQNLIEQRRYPEAIDALDKAIDAEPKRVSLLSLRARVFLQIGEPEKAEADMDRSLAIAPDDSEAYFVRGAAHVWAANRSQQQEDGQNTISECAAAVGDLDAGLKLNPFSGLGYGVRGQCEAMTSHCDRAIPDYDKAVQYEPERMDWLKRRAFCEQQTGDFSAMRKDCDAAINGGDRDPETFRCRATALFRLGHYVDAKSDYDASVVLESSNPNAYLARGNAYRELGICDEAITDYATAIFLDPRHPGYRISLAQCLVAEHSYVEAIASYNEVIRLDPISPEIYEARGVVKLLINDMIGAWEDMEIAKTLPSGLRVEDWIPETDKFFASAAHPGDFQRNSAKKGAISRR